MHEIADRSVVFEIADMVVMPTLLPNLLFWWQYAYRLHNLQKGGRLRICMMIDEAHQYIFSEAYAQQVRLATGTAPVSVIIDRCRDLGMGIIALSQRPSEMNQTLMSTAATKIYLTVDGIQDQRYAVENLDLSDEQKAVFQRMTPRQAIVKRSSGYTQPLTIETVTFDRGEIPSDEEIDRLMAGRIQALVKTCEFIRPITPSTSTSPSVSPQTLKSQDADPSMFDPPTVDASLVTDAPTAGVGQQPQVKTQKSKADRTQSLADVVRQRFKTSREIKIAHGIIHDIWERPLAYTTTHLRISDFCQRNPEWTTAATNRVVTRLCNEKRLHDYGILRKVFIAVAGRGRPKILDFTPEGR